MIENHEIECAYDELGCLIENFLCNLNYEDYKTALSHMNYIGGLLDAIEITEVEEQ